MSRLQVITFPLSIPQFANEFLLIFRYLIYDNVTDLVEIDPKLSPLEGMNPHPDHSKNIFQQQVVQES